MLNLDKLTFAVDLQQQSYQLLKWMGDAVSKGLITFDAAHDYSSLPEAAEKWIAEHYWNIPPRARPNEEHLPEFCAFFSTYLETSFDLKRDPGKQLFSPDAHCFCLMCSWMIDAPNLKAKKPTPADKRRARSMMKAAVQNIAAAQGTTLTDDNADAMLDDPDTKEAAALVAYAADLLNRVNGLATGPAVLVLWRQFAWTRDGSPKKQFKLSTELILEKEKQLCEKVQKQGAGDEAR